MSRAWLLGLAAAWAAVGVGCSQQAVGNQARLVGTQDLVLVDQLSDDPDAGTVSLANISTQTVEGVVTVTVTGTPNRYVFVTSVDSDELRVMRFLRADGQAGRQFIPAPNPVETLSIPVLSRPSMLAVDEGLHQSGRRVTGSYVYAGRPGGALVSVVGARENELRAIGRNPIALPAPLTAMAAWMGEGLTTLPAKTSLFVATFDGRWGGVYRVELTSDSKALRQALAAPGQVALERLASFDGEAVVDVKVIPALAGRTADGQPFCDAKACLAVATRKSAGLDGRTLVLELETGRQVPVAFGGPVRELAGAGRVAKLFGVLDEEKCGGPSCGGVLGADLTSAGPGGFPVALDFSGQPMQPITTGDSLPMGVSLGEGAILRQTWETFDGGARELGLALQQYELLGAVSSSNGGLTFFDGQAGTVIDYDARRTTVSSATLTTPGALDSFGEPVFLSPDGGGFFSTEVGVRSETIPVPDDGGTLTEPWRIVSVSRDAGTQGAYVVDLSDGYLESQNLVAIYEGQVPGLVALPTTAADGVTLAVPGGAEARAAVGDRVIFREPIATTGALAVCGVAQVASIAAGTLTVDQVPTACAGRTQFSVRASGSQPLVLAADREGYLGRGAVGDTITYTRRYQAKPPGWQASRPALRVTLGDSVPALTGAYWAFPIEGGLASYRLSFDSQSCTSPSLPGRVALGELPTLSDTAGLAFPWEVVGVFPSGNTLFELPLGRAYRGTVTNTDGFWCYR